MYVAGEFKNPDTSINAVSWGQYDEDYIRPDADLETRPPSGAGSKLSIHIHSGWMTLVSSSKECKDS